MSRILQGSSAIHTKKVIQSDPLEADHSLDILLILKKKELLPKQRVKLNRFCSEYNLSIKKINLNARQIELTGRAGDIQKAFKTQLHWYVKKGFIGNVPRYHAHTGELTSPFNFITGILGLNGIPIADPYIRLPRKVTAKFMAAPLTPPQLAKLYNFPTGLDGTGQSIALIELGGGYNQSDLDAYFSNLGIPGTPNVVSIGVDGAQNNPADTSGANSEVVLDIEIAAAIAPKATICVYFAPNTDKGFYDAINAAINDKIYAPSIISISWGGPEKSWSASSLQSFNALFQSAAKRGITILAAAGDNLASDGISGKNVDFPSSSPYVLACGGTELYFNGTQITSEIVWNEGDSGTGGGISTVFPLPDYQKNITSLKSKEHRGIPDVSGDADPNTGYIIHIDGADNVVGGTSAVAPLWAGLLALVNQYGGKSVGDIHAQIYSHPTVCRDITSGNNKGFSAGKAWDACSGWGSPDGTAILQLLAPIPASAAPPPSPPPSTPVSPPCPPCPCPAQ